MSIKNSLRLPIKGTSLTANFLNNQSGSNSPLYYKSSEFELSLASTDAGNSDSLYVGGGGINGAFGKALSNQITSLYEHRHLALVEKCGSKLTDFEKYSDDDPMMLSLIFNNRVKGDDSYEGIVFVDIFADQYCPNGNEQNIAMLYVAPPYGPNYENEEDFIVAISETAKNISNALISYNEMVKSHTDLSIIEAIRLCTYSSGIYNRSPKVGVDIISTSIFDSLVAVLKATESGLKEIQLPNGLGQFSTVLKQLQN